MAYKFQLGSATLSGSTTFEEDVTVASLDASNGGITQAGAIAGATTITATGVVSSSADGRFLALDINGTEAISDARAGDLSSLALNSGGITDAGAIAGATTISGSGAITGGSFTADGAVTGGSLTDGSATLTAGGLTLAGALGGATTISGSGAISGGSVSTDGAVTGGSLTDGTATLSAGALAGATTISGSGNISGGGLEIGGGTIINNLAGSGLTVSGNSLTVSAYAVTPITDGGDLATGINFMTASANGVSVTVPTGSGLTDGDTFRVKTRMAEGNTFTITRTGTDVIDSTETSITLESPGAAVDLVYVGLGNFIIL